MTADRVAADVAAKREVHRLPAFHAHFYDVAAGQHLLSQQLPYASRISTSVGVRRTVQPRQSAEGDLLLDQKAVGFDLVAIAYQVRRRQRLR